jgi:hypothetical protein
VFPADDRAAIHLRRRLERDETVRGGVEDVPVRPRLADITPRIRRRAARRRALPCRAIALYRLFADPRPVCCPSGSLWCTGRTTKESGALDEPATRGHHMRRGVVVSLIAVLASLAANGVRADSGGPASDGLKPGDVLDSSSWQRAENLLPPEVLKHYEKNEYVNKISSWPEDVYNWPEDFQAASKQNAGKYKIGKLGEILDASTGKQPPYILGFPFPQIDPNDADAAVKAVWNFF